MILGAAPVSGSVLRAGPPRRGGWSCGIAPLVLLVLLLGSLPVSGAGARWAPLPIGGLTGAAPHPLVPLAVGPLTAAAETLRTGGGPSDGHPWTCSPRTGVTARCGVSGGAAASWWEALPTQPRVPPVALLVEDVVDHEVLLIDQAYSMNGTPANDPAAAFYTFNGSAWTQLPLENGPAYSPAAAIAYDSSQHEVVYELPVAEGNGIGFTETWTFTAGVWTEFAGTSNPPARYFPGLSDDPPDSGVLLFGGENATTGDLVNDTWIFSSTGWAAAGLAGTAPDPRTTPGMAWDSSSSSVVLLGGCGVGRSGPCTNDTWVFSNHTWTHRGAIGPDLQPGSAGTMRYLLVEDPLAGGVAAVPLPPTPTTPSTAPWWVYTGSAWTALPTSGTPQSVNGTSVAYDPDLSKFLAFPAAPGGNAANRTTWTGSGATWQEVTVRAPAARDGASMAYDAADGYVVLVGGSTSGSPGIGPQTNDTWAFSGGVWSRIATNQSPPATSQPGLVYDVHDGYVLLFGGVTGNTTVSNQTWEFTKGDWSRITPHTSPAGPALRDGSLVYDGADGYVVWVAGTPGSAYTWTYFAGNWTNRTGTDRPSGPPLNGLVYDGSDDYVLEQGTAANLGFGLVGTSQTWTFLNGVWTNRTSPSGPPVLEGASMAFDPQTSQVVLFGGFPPYSLAVNSTWLYAGGNWTTVAGPFDPMPLAYSAMVFDGADQYLLLFGGSAMYDPSNGAVGCTPWVCNETYRWSAASLDRPYLSGFSASTPELDLGQATILTANVTGGTGPLRYVYQGLPSGCTSANTSMLRCAPSTTGDFRPSVTVIDVAGHVAGTTTDLNVTRPLAIAVFNASPATVSLAHRTLLSVQVSGGTGEDSYAYVGLPPGCTTQSVPTLPCIPDATGTFPISVLATDSGGGSGSTAIDLTVRSVGPPDGPTITGFALEPAALVLGNSTTIVVNASGGDPPLRYAYSGLPPGCLSLNVSSLGCSPTTQGVYEVTLTVQGANGSSASVMTNLTVYPAGGGGGLQITSFSGGPAVLPLGQSTVISVTATDGLGGLTYAYAGLPPGCASANTSSLNCTPATNGTYRLYVLVHDAAGHQSGAFGNLEVTGSLALSPSISLFSAAPRTFRLGGSTVLFVSVDGGAQPLHYAYADLPTGCVGASVAELNCTPSASGHFTVIVTVTDARARSANASLPVVVLPAEVPAGGSNPFANFGLGPLATVDGALALVFVIAAALLFAGTEITVRRTRERAEGQELLRALRMESAGARPPSGAESDSFGPDR